MSDFKLLICLFITMTVMESGLLYVTGKSEGEISPYLKLVATVDGKTFFSDCTRRNWTAASDYCKQMGMKLASITSEAQFNALKATGNFECLDSHWTSGRDALEIRQFTWDSASLPLSGGYLNYRPQNSYGALTCVLFYNRAGDPYTHSVSCSSPAGALCEASNN